MTDRPGNPRTRVRRDSRRHYLGGRHYPPYAPKILWHRLSHRLAGPLLGCSCSRCFYSPWRIDYPARDRYADRVRLARLEDAVRNAGIEVPTR